MLAVFAHPWSTPRCVHGVKCSFVPSLLECSRFVMVDPRVPNPSLLKTLRNLDPVACLPRQSAPFLYGSAWTYRHLGPGFVPCCPLYLEPSADSCHNYPRGIWNPCNNAVLRPDHLVAWCARRRCICSGGLFYVLLDTYVDLLIGLPTTPTFSP